MWNLELVLKGFLEAELKDVFKICFKTSTNSAFQWFSTLHKKMLVNEYLKTIKGIEKETCTFLFVNVNVKVFHMYFYLHKRFEYLE